MSLNNPFNIPSNVSNSSDLYENYIFSNNRGEFF